jgi:hypothetical protein
MSSGTVPARWLLTLVCATTLAITIDATAQVWVRRFDGPGSSNDIPQALQVGGAGHVYVSGFSSDYYMGFIGAITVRYDAAGNDVWSRVDSEGRCQVLELTRSGSVVIAGIAGPFYAQVARFTNYWDSGVRHWQHEYQGTSMAARVTADQGLVAACYAGDTSSSGTKLVRYDSLGDLLWERDFGACLPEAVRLDAGGQICVTGDDTDRTTYVVYRFDSLGNLQWERHYSGSSGPVPASPRFPLWITDDGHAHITLQRGVDIVTLKVDPLGGVLWERVYDGPAGGQDVAHSLCVDRAGNVYIAGTVQGIGTMADMALLKYDAAGNLQWERFYDGGHGEDRAWGLRLDSAADSYVIGESYGGIDQARDFVAVRWSTTGARLWERRYDGPSHIDDVPLALGVCSDHVLYVTGKSFDVATQGDYATIKYNACAVRDPGDVDSDGAIGLMDILKLAYYIYKKGLPPVPCAAAGDFDCDGTVSARDVILLVNYAFKDGQPPCDVCNSSLAAACP